MSGCSNVWNPKTLRSAAGAHLKVPIKSNVTWDVLHRVVPVNTQVFTFLNATHNKLFTLRIKKSGVLVFWQCIFFASVSSFGAPSLTRKGEIVANSTF
jgi:tRNA G18 (ribose-2'-O)-methylase SpoU